MQVPPDPALLALGRLHQLALEPRSFRFPPFSRRNVRSDRHILFRSMVAVQKRKDRGVHPVKVAALRSVLNFTMPDLAAGNRAPEILEKVTGVQPGIDDAVIL